MTRLLNIVAAAIVCLSCSEKSKQEEKPADPQEKAGEVAVCYTTTSDRSQLFERKVLDFVKVPGINDNYVTISDAQQGQQVDGFGAALTGAACYNLLRMEAADRTALLKELFDPGDGLGISLIRVSIGASDFSVNEEFTWCDTPGIENFAVHKEDRDYLFPILREVYAINPGLRIIASPWSAPRWMKRRSVTDQSDYYSWTSGSLRPDCYKDYATYFVKWIETMKAEGFDIYAMTIQNEPLNHGNSMSMYMGWEEQRDFIKQALGPAFASAGISTKILLFDHNYNYDGVASQKDYPLNIYKDKEASKYVAGSAWHNYGGDVSELSHIASAAPDKEIYFTEASIGTWNYDFGNCLTYDFQHIFMDTMKYGSKGVTLWNLMLDSERGPYRPGGCSTCFGAITLQGDRKTLDRTSHYYDIAHASKVIRPGAVKLGTSGYTQNGLSYQAFLNPDGTHGLIICNDGTGTQVVFKDGTHSVKVTIPQKGLVSVIW